MACTTDALTTDALTLSPKPRLAASDAVAPREVELAVDRPMPEGMKPDETVDLVVPSVRGTVRLRVGGRIMAARGLDVWLKRTDGEGKSKKIETNVFGDWVVSGDFARGTWVVCSGARGLEEACDAVGFELIPGREQVVAPDHVRQAPSTTIAGRVTLADGTPCVWRFPLHGVTVDTLVSADRAESAPVRTNSAGEFALFSEGTPPARVRVVCEGASTTVDADPDAWLAVTLDNRPPDVRGLVAFKGDAAVEQKALGEALRVRADAVDPEGDVLSARWLTNSGPLPDRKLEARFTPKDDAFDLEVLVGDGRGGYDLEPLRIASGPPSRPSGVVRTAADVAVVGATIRQGAVSTTTDAEGAWKLPDWRPDEPMVVSAAGFVDRVVASDHRPSSHPLTLLPCERITLDAKAGGEVRLPSNPTRLAVTVPPGAILDAGGKVATGSVELCLALLDASVEQPLGAVVADRTPRALAPATTAWVDVRAADAPSKRMSFAPGSNVQVALAPTRDELARIGPEHRTFAYRDGRWTPGAPPSLRRERVVIPLAAPGGVTVGVSDDFGCVRLWLGALQYGGPYEIRWRLAGSAPSSGVVVPVTPGLDILTPLPARRNIVIALHEAYGNHPLIGERTVNSGSVSLTPPNPLGTRFPYDRCGTDVVLPPPQPVTGVDSLSRFELTDAVATDGTIVTAQQLASGYVNRSNTAVNGNPSSIAGFWSANFIWVAPNLYFNLPGVAYQRRFDNGVGRQVSVTRFGPDALSNQYRTYAHIVMTPDLESAITVDKNQGGPEVRQMLGIIRPANGSAAQPQRVVFYAYAPAQVATINIDGRLKPMPTVCQNCHGGNMPDVALLADQVKQTNKWSNLDIGARMLPFALDTLRFYRHGSMGFGTPALEASHSRQAQESALRYMNAVMLLSGTLTPTARQLVHGSYGSTNVSSNALPAGATYNDAWHPPGGAAVGWDADPTLYDAVIGNYCRVCHMSLPSLDFGTYQSFVDLASTVEYDLCTDHSMPHSPTTYMRFWNSANPHAPGVLGASMQGKPGWSGAPCGPS